MSLQRTKVTSKPTVFPVTLSDIKQELRLRASDCSKDGLLEQARDAAVGAVETYLNIKVMDQELTAYLDSWPSYYYDIPSGTYEMPISCTSGYDCLELDCKPASSITEISTFDCENVETVFDSANYYLDNFDDNLKPRVVLNENVCLPTNVRKKNGYKIVYRSGTLLAVDVLSQIKSGILKVAVYLYHNPGSCNDCGCVAAADAKSFLEPLKVVSL